MIFATYWFVVFAAVFFPVYWALRSPAARAGWLLAGCAVFHFHFAGPAGVVPIVLLGLVTYACGLSRRRWLCHLAIVLCVLALCFYKYAAFLSGQVLGLLQAGWGAAAQAETGKWLPGAPPLGISFFVFEFVHYLVEVGRGHEPLRRPLGFALFTIYFPSLVAGPIKRYQDFSAALAEGTAGVGTSDVARGLQRVAGGLFKKLVLADNLNLALNYYEASFASLSAGASWLFLGGLGARILLDFSGYSDIAIGLARMMGIRLPENFNYPYLATSLQDFWQRWHISLSSWIRDYVYIPLGGSRHGVPRRIANALVAFGLCGLWHGAAWHFVLWGLWHGAGLVVNATYPSIPGLGPRLQALFRRWPPAGWLLTLGFVMFGWLPFFYPPALAWPMAVKLVFFR